MKTSLFPLVAVALLFGCQDTPVGASASSAALPAQFDELAGGIQFARDTDATNDERMHSMVLAARTTLEIAATADTWKDAHAATQHAIGASESDLDRATLEQAAAKMMLTGHLIPNADDPEAARLALDYAERLVERRSPEAEVVLAAVTAFGDDWPEAQTVAVATGAADALETYVEEGGSCEDCERTEAAQRSLQAAGQAPDVWTARQMSAAARLREAVR